MLSKKLWHAVEAKKRRGEHEKSYIGIDIYKAQLTKIKNASQKSTNTSWKPDGKPHTLHTHHNLFNLLTAQQIMFQMFESKFNVFLLNIQIYFVIEASFHWKNKCFLKYHNTQSLLEI